MARLTCIIATLAAASALPCHAQTLFGSGGVFMPAQPSCQMRLPNQCLPVGNPVIMREAAAKSAYVVPAIEANKSWETVHRLDAMLAKRRSGSASSRDLTSAANDASNELKTLRDQAAGEYKLPYLSAGMNGFLGAAAGLAPGGWQVLTKPAAAISSEIAIDTINHVHMDYTRPEKQYELFQRNLDAELNSSQTIATAFAVAARDPDFARALDYELRDLSITSKMTSDQVRQALIKKDPSLGLSDLKNELTKSDADLEKDIVEKINNAGAATINALKEEFARQDDLAHQKAVDEQKLAAATLQRKTAHEAAEGGLMLAVQIIGMSDPQAAARIQSVGGSALKIYDTVDHFAAAIHADKLTSTLGAAAMTANIAVIGLALVSSFASQGPDSSAIILQQIQAIQQQLTELRSIIDDHFLSTDLRLASMTQIMVDNFAQIHNQLATGNFDDKAIYDKTDKVLSSVQALSLQIDDRFQKAIDILAAPDMTCFVGPINYPDLSKHFNELLTIHRQCMDEATKMVTKETFAPAVAGDDIDPTSTTADNILAQIKLGASVSPVPSWAGIKVRSLQMAAVADGLSTMPTKEVPDPASWMAYANEYVNFSLVFEPIRRKLGVNPSPQTNAIIQSGRTLGLFYDALRPSSASASFYYKRLASLQQANADLLNALKTMRHDFQANDGLNGWSIEELKWLSSGGADRDKPSDVTLKFATTLRPAMESAGIVNLAPCGGSLAKETLTIGIDDLPVIDPLQTVLEQVDNKPINMCYTGTLESQAGSYGFNHAHDTTWFYRQGTVRVHIVASAGSDVLATRDWVSPGPIQYSAEEYNCQLHRDPSHFAGWVDNRIPRPPYFVCPPQDFLDYWVQNHEFRNDSGNILGSLVHPEGRQIDANLNGLTSLLPGHTLKSNFTPSDTVGGPFTAEQARKRLASVVDERSQVFGDLAYNTVLGGGDIAPTGTRVPLADVTSVRDAAARAYALKAVIGVYMQLGTPELFESDAKLVELFYGEAGHRLLDPYAISKLWGEARGKKSVLEFEADLQTENRSHHVEAVDGVKRMMEGPQVTSPNAKSLAFTERFQRIQNDLTLLRILQADSSMQRSTKALAGKSSAKPSRPVPVAGNRLRHHLK